MASSLTTQLIVRVLDQATGPARAIANAIRGVGAAARSVSGGFDSKIAGLQAAMAKNNAAMEAARGRVVDAVAGFYALQAAIKGPVDAAAEFQSVMLDIAQKADMSDEAMAKLGAQVKKLSRDMGAGATETAKGMDNLMGKGLDADRALKALTPITKTALAYRASIDDVASASFTLMDTLKIKPEQLTKALDMMAQAGKEGAFELKDMAKEFPVLSAGAVALGMTGETAVGRLVAALQIARKGAADGATAANNVKNLMQKIISPETTKKFTKQGIDIRKELKKVQSEGGDVFEFIDRMTDKALKGDWSKLGDLFQDAQVQDFLRPLHQNIEEYRRIRKAALEASGVVEADYARRMKTFAAETNRFKAAIELLNIAVGTALFPTLTKAMHQMTRLIERFTAFSEANPKLVGGILSVVKAIIALRIAMIAATFVAGLFRGGVLAIGIAALTASKGVWRFAAALGALAVAPLIAAFNALRLALVGFLALLTVGGWGTALRALAVGLLALLNPLRLVAAAFALLKVALVASGIGAIVAAIAAAGVFIYQNWNGLGEMFSSFGKRISETFPAVGAAFAAVSEGVSKLWKWVTDLIAPLDESGVKWREFGTAAADAVINAIAKIAELVAAIVALPGKILAALGSAAGLLYDWGAQLIQGLIDGIKNKVGELLGYVTGIGSKIKAALGGAGNVSIDGLHTPAAPAVRGKRARGGPVSSGSSYLVGEKGPEVFTANRTGSIIPNGAGGGAQVSIDFSPTINVHGNGDAEELGKKVKEKMEEAAREALRSVFADTGLRVA